MANAVQWARQVRWVRGENLVAVDRKVNLARSAHRVRSVRPDPVERKTYRDRSRKFERIWNQSNTNFTLNFSESPKYKPSSIIWRARSHPSRLHAGFLKAAATSIRNGRSVREDLAFARPCPWRLSDSRRAEDFVKLAEYEPHCSLAGNICHSSPCRRTAR